MWPVQMGDIPDRAGKEESSGKRQRLVGKQQEKACDLVSGVNSEVWNSCMTQAHVCWGKRRQENKAGALCEDHGVTC